MANEMKIDGLKGYSRLVNQSLIVKFEGAIDHFSTQQASRFLMGQIDSADSSVKRLVIDLEQVSYMSSIGIGMLTQCLKALREKNQEMYLLKIQQKVLDVLELLGFSKFFQIVYNIKEIPDTIVKKVESIFPLVVSCPVCNKKYRVQKNGRYKCKNCNNNFSVSLNGKTAYS